VSMHGAHRFARGNGRGYTLIELMITVVVVAVLAAIALPAYQQVLRKGNRADAKAILMETAQFMERYFTTNSDPDPTKRGYFGAAVLSGVSPKGASGSDVKYSISFVAPPTADAYVLQAEPKNSQAADSCGTLTLSNTGAQTADAAGCW